MFPQGQCRKLRCLQPCTAHSSLRRPLRIVLRSPLAPQMDDASSSSSEEDDPSSDFEGDDSDDSGAKGKGKKRGGAASGRVRPGGSAGLGQVGRGS
jgi:hypothetical protein